MPLPSQPNQPSQPANQPTSHPTSQPAKGFPRMAYTQRAVCVLGRAMNLHNVPETGPDPILDRPAVQAALALFSGLSFFALFV